MKYRPYSDIKSEFKNTKIPYDVLLTSEEWNDMRQIIINRERNVCQICACLCMDDYLPISRGSFVEFVPATYEEDVVEKFIYNCGEPVLSYDTVTFKLKKQEVPKIPHVHHTYYLLGNLPWEYPDKDLMLVCHECHQNIHDNEIIKVYRNKNKIDLANFKPCAKCNGSGYLLEYDYYMDGVCFDCKGACFQEWN